MALRAFFDVAVNSLAHKSNNNNTRGYLYSATSEALGPGRPSVSDR